MNNDDDDDRDATIVDGWNDT